MIDMQAYWGRASHPVTTVKRSRSPFVAPGTATVPAAWTGTALTPLASASTPSARTTSARIASARIASARTTSIRTRLVLTTLVLTAWMALGAAVPLAAADEDFSLLKLRNGKRVCLEISGKDRTYYSLDEPLEFDLYGPRTLRLYTRHLPRGDHRVGRRLYTLVVERDQQIVLVREIYEGRSDSVVLCEDPRKETGDSCRSDIRVPDDKHHFRISIRERGKEVAVRPMVDEREQNIEWLVWEPERFSNVYTLLRESGNTYLHYGFTDEAPLLFTAKGPCHLRVYTRLNLPPTAGQTDRFSYRIELKRNGEAQKIFQYETDRLENEYYVETDSVIPAKYDCIELDVPDGTWSYGLHLVAGDLRAATARILIPKSCLDLR